ncbi:TadE/TadG family type IV pilus assembly protein [Phenylobacterium deserti]|uniref:TadE-like domain-containing protein n=1 Tax=Phenylobacterium deserti TaxID=1914756 RepID=A0A328ACZ1_9CAUL|nr:TadE/TadG family type IV pilus assembly protein [Phenylobacterium deserti]RAK52367.1 hypothetical protein DJ018_14650 [Phenylobacterium deserti]
MSRIRRLAADQSGASLVELALVLPIFLALLIGTIQIAILEVMSVNFNNAVLEASRAIRTNNGPATTAAQFRQAICNEMAGRDTCLQKVKIAVQSFSNFDEAVKPPKIVGEPFDSGRAEQIVLVTATYSWPMLMPFAADSFPRAADGLHVEIVARTMFKNEPWWIG